MMSDGLLVGDLGATNARFALASPDGPGYSSQHSVRCCDYASPIAAIEHYLERIGLTHLAGICLAVAAPVTGDEIRFINNDWRISSRDLQERFEPAKVQIINDFKAAAWSIPLLGSEDLLPIAGPTYHLDPSGDFSVGMIGPGTGLGISGMMREAGSLYSISGEGGHQGFSPHSSQQQEVFDHVRNRFGRTSSERLLSGPGIENIYQAVQETRGIAASRLSAADIMQRAVEGSDEAAVTTETLFYEMLGQVAGDLALLIGAYDGLLVGGGIAPRYPERLLASRFREGFENKGRHEVIMKAIPTCLVTHPNPGLLGASHLVRAH